MIIHQADVYCVTILMWGCLFLSFKFTLLNSSIANYRGIDGWILYGNLMDLVFLYAPLDGRSENSSYNKMNVASSYLPSELICVRFYISTCLCLFPYIPIQIIWTGISLAWVGCCFNYINALGKLKSHILNCIQGETLSPSTISHQSGISFASFFDLTFCFFSYFFFHL